MLGVMKEESKAGRLEEMVGSELRVLRLSKMISLPFENY